MGSIDGEKWRKTRMAFLREQIASGDLTDGQRVAAETEIAQLERERALGSLGLRAPGRAFRWLRRARGG
jgi:hypothetical protein